MADPTKVDPFGTKPTEKTSEAAPLFNMPPFEQLSGVQVIAHYEAKNRKVSWLDYELRFTGTMALYGEVVPVTIDTEPITVDANGDALMALVADLKTVFGEAKTNEDHPKPTRAPHPYRIVVYGAGVAAAGRTNPF
jgi:hypothetical protein